MATFTRNMTRLRKMMFGPAIKPSAEVVLQVGLLVEYGGVRIDVTSADVGSEEKPS